MQQAIAPALHGLRNGQDNAEQNMHQALLMAGHQLDEQQRNALMMDHPDPMSSGESKRGGGKRELSTSKRAAQNRAAQRAFRQRKEGHIKKLEEQVRDYQILTDNFKAVQAENYQLRDYIINLQSRLIESQGDFPPAPGNIDLRQPLSTGTTDLTHDDADTERDNGPAAPMAESALGLVQENNKAEKDRIGLDPILERP